MSGLEYTSSSLPPVDEFVEELRRTDEQYDPVEKLLSLERELSLLEQKHNLTSAEFHRRYLAGEMGDALEYVSWVGRYKQYLELKRMISSSLDQYLYP